MSADATSDPTLIALINQLGSTSANQEKQQTLEQQMKLAEALRNFQMPKGTSIPSGTGRGAVYVAPNALQDLAAAGQNAIAQGQGQSAVGGMMSLAKGDQASRTAMLRELLRQHLMQGNPQVPNGQIPTNAQDSASAMTPATDNSMGSSLESWLAQAGMGGPQQ